MFLLIDDFILLSASKTPAAMTIMGWCYDWGDSEDKETSIYRCSLALQGWFE